MTRPYKAIAILQILSSGLGIISMASHQSHRGMENEIIMGSTAIIHSLSYGIEERGIGGEKGEISSPIPSPKPYAVP